MNARSFQSFVDKHVTLQLVGGNKQSGTLLGCDVANDTVLLKTTTKEGRIYSILVDCKMVMYVVV